MSVNYKVGADVGSFKQGMSEAQASLKTLDAALKVNEASFKAGGDAEIYMQQKTQLLTDKMTKQKALVTQLQTGLRQMREQGVSPTSVAYQQMEQKLLNAQTAMLETKSSIDSLDGSQQKAAKSAGTLSDSVNSINKKVSLDAVISGINSITGALENAASRAASVGTAIWDNVMNSAKWADDTATMAMMLDMTAEEYQKVAAVAATTGETSVEAWVKAKQKLATNMVNGNDSVLGLFEKLGVKTTQVTGVIQKNSEEFVSTEFRDATDVFWELGEALMNMDNATERDAISSQLLGRSWKELVPMFRMGREAYEEALENVDVVNEDNVNSLGALNDKVTEVEQRFETLKNTLIAEIAPALTDVADVISGLLHEFNEYLKTDDGKKMLESLGDAVTALFSDIANIDPEKAVESFTGAFNTLTSSLQWLKDNSEGVVTALEVIVTGWAGLKLTGGALQILQLVNGVKGLTGSGGDGGSGGGGNLLGSMFSKVKSYAPEIIKGLPNMALTAAPFVIAVDGIIQDQKNINAMNEDAQRRLEAYAETTRNAETVTDPGLQTAWSTIMALGDTDNAINSQLLQAMAERYLTFMNSGIDESNPLWDTLAETLSDETFDSLAGWMEQILTGGQDYQNGAFERTELLDKITSELTDAINASGAPEVEVDPQAPDNAAEILQQQIGTVNLEAVVTAKGIQIGGLSFGTSHANGIWSVPFDGYPAILHKGERVTPAREVSSRSYNSNLYIEKMYMNNGTDAQGLANAMAAAQRRRNSGYGS